MTTRAISTSTPRVNLPDASYLRVPEVREALDNYLRVYRERNEARTRLTAAETAHHNAEASDRSELAEVIVAGGNVGAVKSSKERAAEELDRARAELEAYVQAVGLAHGRLIEAVDAHRAELVADLAERHRAAAVSFARHAAGIVADGAELNATGELLAMLEETPRSLSVRSWRPGAKVSIAASALAEALPVVQASASGASRSPVGRERRKLTLASLADEEHAV